MTWEIISALIVLLGAFISVLNVVVRVNRTLVSLERTVQTLIGYIEKQDKKNGHFYSGLNILDKRVTLLENGVFGRHPKEDVGWEEGIERND